MATSTDTLLDQALSCTDQAIRRRAFVELVRSDRWRQVLAPHVLSRQGYDIEGQIYADWPAFEDASASIAESEEKIQRCLELIGCRFAGELMVALARKMGKALVEHVLPHVRTADPARATLLLYVLQEADNAWVKLPEAAAAIRRQMKQVDVGRISLMLWLAEAGTLGDYAELIEEYPPMAVEEWSALGRGNVANTFLINRALAILPHHPAPLLYLLRLEPLPTAAVPRMMASGRGEWIASALEISVADGLSTRALVPLAELGVRLGGRSLSAANSWISSSRLSCELLEQLRDSMRNEDGHRRVSELLWIRRRAPSADRALEQGRRGKEPDALDAAALVRQLRGEKAVDLVAEIIEKPREMMIESVLRPLCAVNRMAAQTLQALAVSTSPKVAKRAQSVLSWPDVLWPEADDDEEDDQD